MLLSLKWLVQILISRSFSQMSLVHFLLDFELFVELSLGTFVHLPRHSFFIRFSTLKTLYGCTSTWTCVVPCSFVGNILICEYLLQWYIVTKLRHLVHYQLFLSLLWISKAIFHPPNSIFFLTIVIYNHSSTNLGYRW